MTAYELATRYVGIKEVPGIASNPQILRMLQLDDSSVKGDDVPWCSAFVNYVAWHLRLPRSKSLAARSWLTVGQVIDISSAKTGFDVVILARGSGKQPGPEIIKAQGHVGFFSGADNKFIYLLGGNQGEMVNISAYDKSRLPGVRRLTVDMLSQS